jgi:hypothetical protein
MNSTYHIIRGTALLIIAIGFLGWALVHTLKRSEDPARLIFKWILTAIVIGFDVLEGRASRRRRWATMAPLLAFR